MLREGITSMNLQEFLGIDRPIVQALMAGVQGSELAIAVSNAGGLGSLPCALLGPEALRSELIKLREGTEKPFSVNFFTHTPPEPNATQESAWRKALAPYYREFDIDPDSIPARGIVNRVIRELGPICSATPEFPLAGTAIAPLKASAEAKGSGDFSSLWSGQNASGCREIPAAEQVRRLTEEL